MKLNFFKKFSVFLALIPSLLVFSSSYSTEPDSTDENIYTDIAPEMLPFVQVLIEETKKNGTFLEEGENTEYYLIGIQNNIESTKDTIEAYNTTLYTNMEKEEGNNKVLKVVIYDKNIDYLFVEYNWGPIDGNPEVIIKDRVQIFRNDSTEWQAAEKLYSNFINNFFPDEQNHFRIEKVIETSEKLFKDESISRENIHGEMKGGRGMAGALVYEENKEREVLMLNLWYSEDKDNCAISAAPSLIKNEPTICYELEKNNEDKWELTKICLYPPLNQEFTVNEDSFSNDIRSFYENILKPDFGAFIEESIRTCLYKKR